MRTEQQVRELLGPADPARYADPPAGPPATALIALAEAIPPARPARHRPTRRLVLAGGLAAALAVASVGVLWSEHTADDGYPVLDPSQRALVGAAVLPLPYQIEKDPPSAGTHLRALAESLADAPYDSRNGRYTYHKLRSWGDPFVLAEGGRYVRGNVNEYQIWRLADGSGRRRITPLPPEFPDQASRDWWSARVPATETVAPPDEILAPDPEVEPLPADRAALAAWLHIGGDGRVEDKKVVQLYSDHAVPKQVRALVLELLAADPGLRWRGQVTDRAGRTGVAVTRTEPDKRRQSLMIFDPRTGELLAHESVTTAAPGQAGPKRVSGYELILETDRTNQPG